MDKFSLSKSSVDSINNRFLNFIAGTLILLISFNVGWLLMFIRLYSRFEAVRNINKTLINFESFLLLVNFGIVIIFVAYALSMQNLKGILGRR